MAAPGGTPAPRQAFQRCEAITGLFIAELVKVAERDRVRLWQPEQTSL